jgi:hypothetical protein
LGLTCTPIGCKNQQIVRNGKYKKKPKGIEWMQKCVQTRVANF